MRNLYKKVLAALILVIAVAFAVSYIMVLLQNLQLNRLPVLIPARAGEQYFRIC